MLACTFFMVSKYDFEQTFELGNYELEEFGGDNGTDSGAKYKVVDSNGDDVDVQNWIIADALIDPQLIFTMSENPVSSDVMSAYLTSMYFAYSTLTTVGYGDISAHTDIERSIAILSLISGSVIYAVLVGFVNNLVDNSDVKETEYQQRLTAINSFMSNHHLPNELRNRVRRYMELDHNAAHHDIKLLEYLSPMLQREAIMHMNRHFVQDVPFLQDADSIFVWCVLERMIVIVCVQKEYILVEGQVIEAMHIIKSGKVDVIDKAGQTIKTYTQGSFFGENCGQTEKKYAKHSFRAKVDMEICLISQEDLLALLEAFEDFKETLDVISTARDLHDRRESKAMKERMDKMMKHTGMMARAVTPPHGKEWETMGMSNPTGRRSSTSERAKSPSARRDLLDGLGADLKSFREMEMKGEKQKQDIEFRRSLTMIKPEEAMAEAAAKEREKRNREEEDNSEDSESSDSDKDESDKEVEMIISTKSAASVPSESSSRLNIARRRRNSHERKVSVLGDMVGTRGVPGGGVSRATLAVGMRGGAHKTPPPGTRRVSVSESVGGIGGASLAQFARAHGGHSNERETRGGIEVLMTGQERILDMFEDLIKRVEKVEEMVTPKLNPRSLSDVAEHTEKTGGGEKRGRGESDIELDTMLKNMKGEGDDGGGGE
ncbi:hypothetical protein TrRE_jg11934 [Triparma retinervis]|uniref:Cyclic nucleotide-binding domain-containing protein n=1 Tax=Triparma retinervis TaxID=2557542 RepID=A0A9W6ZG09_9STRA|nr:hypothetical protein TrRE_jg11934 [Triparma retinervis]